MIEVRGLTKRYGPVPAVDTLSFDIRPGVVTGFLGPNGSGKSTTMRMMVGLDRPRPVTTVPRWRGAQARLADAVPTLALAVAPLVVAKGRRAQRRAGRAGRRPAGPDGRPEPWRR